MKMIKMAMVAVMSFMLACGPAVATLTATWTPGYVFSANERPTTETLNELGNGTILISGTVDGSTGLTAGSVAGNLLADSVPDGVTLNYNGSAPRQIEILPGGVGWQQVNTNVAGRALSGGFNQASQTGTNLNVNYDGLTIVLNTNNALTIGAGFLAGLFFTYPATPNFTNQWGYAQAFLITNFQITLPTNAWTYATNTWRGTTITTNSAAPALAAADTTAIQSTLQDTNTVTTLGSLAGFVQGQEQQNAGTYTNLTRVLPTAPGVVPWYWGGSTNNATNVTASSQTITVWVNSNTASAMLVDVGGSYAHYQSGSGSYSVILGDQNTNQVFLISAAQDPGVFPVNRFIVPPHYGIYLKGGSGSSPVNWAFTLLATPY
jgi:hypothetical protein